MIEEHLLEFAGEETLEIWQQKCEQVSESIELDCLDEDFAPGNALPSTPDSMVSFDVMSASIIQQSCRNWGGGGIMA